MSDNSNYSGQQRSKVTVADANKAKHGYQGEADIAKRQFNFDTPEPNEEPVVEEQPSPSYNAKTTSTIGEQMGIEDQDELIAALQADDSDDQDFETAEETVEMMGNEAAQFQGQRDIRWESGSLDRGEYWTKPDEDVQQNMGLGGLPVADQSDREPIPELVDRRQGESLAMYEKRVGEEADHERMRQLALSFAEEREDAGVEQTDDTERGADLDAEYTSGWFDELADEDEADGRFDATAQRAESSRVSASEQAQQRRADFEARAKVAAGLEPDEAWSPKARLGEEIVELGEFVDRVATTAHISKGQALTLLCAKRLETESAHEAAMQAVQDASEYFKDAPAPITSISSWSHTTTVEGVVKHLFDPQNSNEYQVALLEDVHTGQNFRFIIHTRARFSKSWTEFNGEEVVTDLYEGDRVRIIDGKPHYDSGRAADVKIHACQWTVMHKVEHGDGAHVTKFAPEGRTIEHSDPTGSEIDEAPVKSRAGYARKESGLHERRAKPANSPESATNFERRETADPLMVQWEYPASWVPEQHMQHYDVVGESADSGSN